MTHPAAATHSLKVILSTALWLTVVGIVVRASGAVKEIVFAGAFGVSGDTDAFVLAVAYTTILPTVLGGAIGTALIAHLANVRRGSSLLRALGEQPASVGIGISVLAIGSALAIYGFAPILVPALFSVQEEQVRQAVAYSRILAPAGGMIILAMAMDAALNAAKQFYVPAITQLATPVAMMAAIFLSARTWGVEAAAWGMLIGASAEVLILAARVAAQREAIFGATAGLDAAGSRERVPGDALGSGMLWRSIGFLSFAGGVAAAAAMIDQVFLSRLETGAITTFNYAFKVNSLLISLFGSAFAAVIYPYLSDLAAARNTAGLKRLALKLAAFVLPLTAAVSIAIYVFSREIVELLFVRGNFSSESALQVAAIQQIFAFQLVFYAAGLLATRVLNAMRAARCILLISCIGVVSVAFFDWLLYRPLGAGGIAWSAVITSMITLVAALCLIRAVLRDGASGQAA